ncbi:MAG TPA: hypothetical protein PKY49_08460 [Anaerolineae bacterium]|nr:hypothetical protein [Anaerolineae bacterium]
MNAGRNPILTSRHPETGQAASQTRESLFTLLAITIALSAILNAVINLLGAPAWNDGRWWAWTLGLMLGGTGLVLLGIAHDDRRIGQVETEIELLLPYRVTPRGSVELDERRSYNVTQGAAEAWRAFTQQTAVQVPDKGAFIEVVKVQHFDLVRYLLLQGLKHFGDERRPGHARHSWLRLDFPLTEFSWEALPPRLQDNPFAAAVGPARPQRLWLPEGAVLTADMTGDCLLRLTWRWRRWLRWGPRGEIRLRWLGPLSEVRPENKRYELLTARLDAAAGRQHVVVTRLVVEVDTHWNFLTSVAGFRDWGLNLAHRLVQQMDYHAWYEYLVQRTILDLDWKIGWIEKGAEPGLVERLRRLDERLARLEAHLWPDEPPGGEAAGAWLSGSLPTRGPTVDEDEAATAP